MSSTSFEPVDDSYRHRVRSSVRDFCARQRGIRIDFKGNRDQGQYKNDDQGFHGPLLAAELGRIGQRSRRKMEVSLLRRVHPLAPELHRARQAARCGVRIVVVRVLRGRPSTARRQALSAARPDEPAVRLES
jgi:hypothetical protein